MQRWTYYLAALALTLMPGSIKVDAQSQTEKKNHASPVRTMLELFDKIDQAPALSPAKASEFLKVTLEPVPQESDEYVYIFRGHGGLWKKVELRLPPKGDGSRFVLVLVPVTPISMKDITAHFGQEFALDLPNPSAGDEATYGYSYDRKKGKLRFSFPNPQDYAASYILFDRM